MRTALAVLALQLYYTIQATTLWLHNLHPCARAGGDYEIHVSFKLYDYQYDSRTGASPHIPIHTTRHETPTHTYPPFLHRIDWGSHFPLLNHPVLHLSFYIRIISLGFPLSYLSYLHQSGWHLFVIEADEKGDETG